jgi:hypothetical protein
MDQFNKNIAFFVVLPIAAVALLYYVWVQIQEAPSPDIRMANPASTYCIEQGGRLEIMHDAAGEVGFCYLPSGRICEEWALYRGECSPE